MKKIFITFTLSILLIFIASEVNAFAYNFMFMPIIDPESGKMNLGSPLNDFAVLAVSIITFILIGLALAFLIKKKHVSIITAMSVGIVSISLELSLSLPWFLLMPSHPALYDHILAFIGFINAPFACALGAFLYSRLISNEQTA